MIEAVISIGIAGVLVLSVSSLLVQAAKISERNISEIKATIYLQELVEVVRSLEISDWSKIECSADVCHTELSGGAWTISSGEEKLEAERYSRFLTIEDVYRYPPTNEVTEEQIELDPDTKKVTGHVKWNDGIKNRETTFETYVYNFSKEE